MIELKKLKAAYAAATPGVWETFRENEQVVKVLALLSDGTRTTTSCPALAQSNDAGFIVLAHNLMPSLLAEIERLQWLEAELQRVRDRADRMDLALTSARGAMATMREQIEQMRGLFDDADGAIAGACRDHDAAESFARSMLAAEGGDHGNSCMDRLYIATAALRDLHVGCPHDEIAAGNGTGLSNLVRELVNYLRENGVDDERSLDCDAMEEIEPQQAENILVETHDTLPPACKEHTK